MRDSFSQKLIVIVVAYQVANRYSLGFVLASLLIPYAQATDEYTRRISGALSDGRPYELTLACVPVDKVKQKRRIPLAKMHGNDGTEPFCLVDEFSLRIGRAALKIPPKSFLDLSNVAAGSEPEVRLKKNRIIVEFHGGDGAGSYRITFIFGRQRLLTREIEEFNERGEYATKRTRFS